ncbi:MAG: diaminopimelate decarboxylase [Dysgonamonadaceae bacterium]|jgi:diaminopimelate decarboxylase|nr:diaminopimelate decarboxylase [Dysgonamonadaceae bacterium]
MIKGKFPVEKFKSLDTPFYFYDIELLRETLNLVKKETENKNFVIHYAIKANANPRILQEIASFGFGADCVSGNEIIVAVENGFEPSKIAFAGVGKTDKEINIALDYDIFCFNVESLPEMEAIEELAKIKNKTARIALRINPNVDAHTHKYITTGLNENKFGIDLAVLPDALKLLDKCEHLELIGIHFHIGSQITDLSAFEDLCVKAVELQKWFVNNGIKLKLINVGGGLGINYQHPNHCPMADFESYFRLFSKYLEHLVPQTIHFELGRSIVAPCGSLITRTTYIKNGVHKKFLIVDAGMTDLIRPALYQAFHHIENICSDKALDNYDIVGPICESSDVFVENFQLNETQRGDLLAIRSAGAYGEVMASNYNCHELPKSFFSDSI